MKFHPNFYATETAEFVAECDEIGAQGRGLSTTAALDRLRDESDAAWNSARAPASKRIGSN